MNFHETRHLIQLWGSLLSFFIICLLFSSLISIEILIRKKGGVQLIFIRNSIIIQKKWKFIQIENKIPLEFVEDLIVEKSKFEKGNYVVSLKFWITKISLFNINKQEKAEQIVQDIKSLIKHVNNKDCTELI